MHRRRSFRIQVAAAALAAVASAVLLSGCVTTVPEVDLGRYVGHWYQPEGYEQPFTAGLVGITADYAANADGTIAVRNNGYRDTCDGAASSIDGTARVVDPTTNAKLEVRFPSVPITEVIPGQYWIIGLDADYRWAIVTDSLRSSLFVLSRTPELPAGAVPEIDAILDSQGFDRTRIKQFPSCP